MAESAEQHETSWSINLEKPRHGADRATLLAEAIDAVEGTASGTHVNLVTHEAHGDPRSYLFDHLADRVGDAAEWEFVERCGCGGYVTRVHV
jgi:putative CGCGG family rSAM target protein